MRAHRIAVPVIDGMPLFEIAVPGEVFGMPRPHILKTPYDVRLCGVDTAVARTSGVSVALETPFGVDELAFADTIIVPALADTETPLPKDLIAALQAASTRGARIASVCTGTFALAAAGLLDGHRATTHWAFADELARRHPEVQVEPNVLYIADQGAPATSAGTAAGIDLCLELLRRDHGTSAAAEVARDMVVPPHRHGGQAQYISRVMPEHPDMTLGPVMRWIVENLDQQLTLREIAAAAGTTPRTLNRRFQAELGMAPLNWLTAQRVRHSQDLLETTDLGIDAIARRSGMGSATNLRAHFARYAGTTPSAYRAAFRGDAQLEHVS